MAELELAERKGELVAVAEVRADLIAKYTVLKTRIMAVPARVAQRAPHVAAQVVPLVDDLLRDALDELANGDSGSDGRYCRGEATARSARPLAGRVSPDLSAEHGC